MVFNPVAGYLHRKPLKKEPEHTWSCQGALTQRPPALGDLPVSPALGHINTRPPPHVPALLHQYPVGSPSSDKDRSMGTLPTAVGPLGLKLGCSQQQVTPPAQRPLRLSPRASQAPGTALPGQLNLNVLQVKRTFKLFCLFKILVQFIQQMVLSEGRRRCRTGRVAPHRAQVTRLGLFCH